jgi:phosphohistidine swiveling domain-containing protein
MSENVRFELPDPRLEEYTWVLFDEHMPVPASPLIGNHFGSFGRVQEEFPPRSLQINGLTYMRSDAVPRPEGSTQGQPFPASVEEMRRWRAEWQPEVDRVIAALANFDPATVAPGAWAAILEEQRREYWRVFGAVHRTAVFPAHQVSSRFQQAYVERFGEARREDALALLQGIPNASLERAGMLWALSRIARAHPEVLEALDRGVEIPLTPGGQVFHEEIQKLLDRFGSSAEGFVEDRPNWREDPSLPLAMVRAYARLEDGRGPLDMAEQQKQRRERLEAELRALAPKDPEVADLLQLLPLAQEHLPNLEDHNYYTDQCLTAASRARWLNIGRHLQGQRLIDAADDIFFLERSELIETLEGRMTPDKALIEKRRAHLQALRSVAPPPVLGKPPLQEATLPDAVKPPPAWLHATELRVLRGVGASAGSYRGRARVIDSIEQAAELRDGDVLVCRTTTPAWTPFFGVISALVTNGGGALSHSAIVAREFGIPAVIGTINGSAVIRDGATVTVDGTNGVVLIED